MIYPYNEDVELKIKDDLYINKNIINYLNQDAKKFIDSFNLKDKDGADINLADLVEDPTSINNV